MPTARPDGLDPGEVARMLAGAVERLNDPVRPDDMDALRAEHARLSAFRRAMLDAGLDLTWKIRLPPLPEGKGWNSLEAQARDAT